ncbi:LamG domain-containing protein [bacterium]|nr:LamG domain-containing protein [bacterium]
MTRGGNIGLSSNTDCVLFANSSNLVLNQWNHLAFVRNGTNLILFINGTEKNRQITSSPMPSVANYLRIGSFDYGSQYNFQGYIDELRITKGVARWTTNFTVPSIQHYWWNWTCNGSNGGSSTTCGANKY